MVRSTSTHTSSAPLRLKVLSLSTIGLLLAALAAPFTLQAAPGAAPISAGELAAAPARGDAAWQRVRGKPAKTHDGNKAELKLALENVTTWSLARGQIAKLLATAPKERSLAAKNRRLVISLPSPNGAFQRFELTRSPIMEPALAARHRDIATYRGVGVDDRTATIRADLTPLGFHASIRSAAGSWYIDPYYHLDQSLYAAYFGRDLKDTAGAPFVERDADVAEISVDHGFYHAADDVLLTGEGFKADVELTITISDPTEGFASRSLTSRTDGNGGFERTFTADPNGNLDTHIVEVTDGAGYASTSYQVVRDDDPTSDPPTGDVLRTYRLALITDPGYATYHGGASNVTAAKVTLMNRVTQVYEDDLSIRMVLVANNDLLNLDTWDQAIGPNGPCGVAACFTQAAVTGCSALARNRTVIGQIIGASNYDIGHLALGQPGGGVANLGVVGRQNKAGGCTGIPTPTGDFYAVDYVAHEMGHQFSGNHPFNGNQLNCSGGNRSAATSVEPGSGSSIMAYAGICTADDLQPHSDPYFSQRSLQEISTYTASDQLSINETHTVSLNHFGGGNEVQVVTLGPGYQRANAIQPLTVGIGAAPSATQLGGLSETGTTVTVSTGAAGGTHTLQPGDSITITGAGDPGYNGTWTVDTVLTSRAFTYTNPTTGLPRTGGGAITLNKPGLSEAGDQVTVRTTLAHGRSVGDTIVITGAGVSAYNGAWTVTSVPTARSLTYTNSATGLANSGAGTLTYSSPFQVRIGGNDSALIGGTGQAYNQANVEAAINAIAGFAGTVTVSGLAGTGFTLTYGAASANTDVPSIEIVNLACGGCFSAVDETTHGGAFDQFTLRFNGVQTIPIVNGTNYTAAAIDAAIEAVLPAGGTVNITTFGANNANGFNNQGFGVTYTGNLALTNLPNLIEIQNFSAGASGFVGETDKGGAVDNKGTTSPTGNAFPSVTVPAGYTIPLRTPFALTGSAADADDDPMTYIWEQNDRGGGAGTSLLNNVKTNGPLFAMFPVSGQISEADTLLYDSPGENHIGSDPTRVFPAMYKILANNTNAETGTCPTGPIAPPVPIPLRECYMEFLPTSDYVGFTGVNASPLSLHFRFTARDGNGGANAADTTLLLAPSAGPFLVNGPGAGGVWEAGSTRTVSWDVANTDVAPISASDVKISLSLDGGWTYPIVLAGSTANDGSADVVVPNVVSEHARVKVEAVGNIFFDVSNADFTVSMPGVIGLDGVTLGGKTTLVDSFDSGDGQYGPSNKTNEASLFSNGNLVIDAARVGGDIRSATGGVTVIKGGLVTGDVTAGGAITLNQGSIGGTATPNTPTLAIAAPAVSACSPYSSNAGLSGKLTYNPATGDLAVGGGKTATLADGDYCFRNVTLSGGAVLAVNGPVRITLNGVLNASGGAFLNTTYEPANLEIVSSYAGVSGAILSSGGPGAYLSLYAPGTGATLSGGAQVYGAVLVKSLALSGGAAIHYDASLVTVWAEHFSP